MDPVTGAGTATGALTASGHPLQRAGAWAVTALAGRTRPEQVTEADLDRVASGIVDDAARAASAEKDTAAYDWWKVLFALYPNSKATHSKRSRDATELTAALTPLFAPDTVSGSTWPCTFCSARTSTLWTKSTLPMFDTNMALNTLPPGVPGWPVCRGCRIAAWALPYGAWVTAGSVTVLSCAADEAERVFAMRNIREARRIMQLGFSDARRSGARPELSAVRAVLALGSRGPASATLWTFKNDNQEPWLRVVRARQSLARFLAVVHGNTEPRRGWFLLERALTRRNRDGQVEAGGADEAARLLFEVDGGPAGPLLRTLHRVLHPQDGGWNARDRTALTRLAFTYAEETLGMEPHLVEPVAQLVADWVEHGDGSPRGRLAEFRRVGLNDYHLGKLLYKAQYRLTLAGKQVPAGPEDWSLVIGQRPRAWESRMLLAARVVQLLQERNVKVGGADDDAGDDAEQPENPTILTPEEADIDDDMRGM